MLLKKLFSLIGKSETKVLFLRRHWIVLVQIVLGNFVFFLIPFILWGIFDAYVEVFWLTNLGRAVITICLSIYFLFIWLLLFYALIDYWLDIWIVTTKRILHIEQKGLFYRIIAELELSRIQDLTSSTKGILPTLLGYGTIYIQTAAELPRFIFRQIPDPDVVREKIMQLIKEARGAQNHGI